MSTQTFNEIIRKHLTIYHETIKKIGGDVEPICIRNPANERQIQALEKELGYTLPSELSEVFSTFTAGIKFYWNINDKLDNNNDFLPDEFCEIFCGELQFDLDFILDYETDRKGWIESVYPNYEDEYDRIYHNKLAFQKVGNGDLIAIELEPENYGKVVYLSHDGSENHGRYMAENFKEFLLNYTSIGCTGGEDWQWEVFCTEKGIDAKGDNAKKWREFLNIAMQINF